MPITSAATPNAPSIDRLTRRDWALVLIPAVLLRIIVLLSGTVSFNSDEAIVGLMARHINQGQPIPVFFYGQPYLGSLDAILVSLGFRIFGEQVSSIRLVESLLYVLIVVTTVLLAYRLSSRRQVAIVAGLCLAIPPVMLTLYTTMTLGGYGETLLLGNLIWLVGWDLLEQPTASGWRWGLLGLLAGLGWWTDALIVAYLIPIGLFLLIHVMTHFKWQTLAWITVAALGFLIGGAPWWIDNLNHNWEALQWLLTNPYIAGVAAQFGISARIIGLLFFNFPAGIGVRYSWTPAYWAGILSVPIVVIGLIAIGSGIGSAIRHAGARRFVTVGFLIYCALVVLSGSGVDSSGRYFLPAVVMFALIFGYAINDLVRLPNGIRVMTGIVGFWLMFQLAGHVLAIRTVPPGLTSQFDPVTDFTNNYDQQAIDFLLAHHGERGYTTYWVTFRLAFLSHEQVILDAWLPNKTSLLYTPVDRRYPPYTQMVKTASNPVYVTASTPELDVILRQSLAKAGVTYSEQTIGPYLILYDLSQNVAPDQLGLESLGQR